MAQFPLLQEFKFTPSSLQSKFKILTDNRYLRLFKLETDNILNFQFSYLKEPLKLNI